MIDLFNRNVQSGTSLITAVKNRPESFEQSLKSWLLCEEIDEIIVVDWTSEIPLKNIIDRYQDGRIILAEVIGQIQWVLAPAFNLAARISGRTKLLKMDADVEIRPDFFARHPLNPGFFYAGNWLNHRNANEMHLNGVLWIFRRDFFLVNGYNEFIRTYGWDDSDLYQRLSNIGISRKDLDNDTLFHIEHEGRTKNQSKPFYFSYLPDAEFARLATQINRQLCSNQYRWTKNETMQAFRVIKGDAHIFQCESVETSTSMIDPEHYREAEVKAMTDRLLQSSAPYREKDLMGFPRNKLIKVYLDFFLQTLTERNDQ